MGGLVVARQRPGTAKGIVFLLVEDEFGTVNLVVPPEVYEAHRLVVRSEPLIYVEGRLEKLAIAGGQINVYVHRIRALDAPADGVADVVDLAARTAAAAGAEGTDRAVAPSPAAAVASAGGWMGTVAIGAGGGPEAFFAPGGGTASDGAAAAGGWASDGAAAAGGWASEGAAAAGGWASEGVAAADSRAAVALAAAGGTAAAGIADFRGVAPPVMSFASGRRR
jgi:error-prone DNA polymerase